MFRGRKDYFSFLGSRDRMGSIKYNSVEAIFRLGLKLRSNLGINIKTSGERGIRP